MPAKRAKPLNPTKRAKPLNKGIQLTPNPKPRPTPITPNEDETQSETNPRRAAEATDSSSNGNATNWRSAGPAGPLSSAERNDGTSGEGGRKRPRPKATHINATTRPREAMTNALPLPFGLLLLLLLSLRATPSAAASPAASPPRAPKCVSVDPYHTYVCTDDPAASRRAMAGAGGSPSFPSGGGGGGVADGGGRGGGSGGDASSSHVAESAFDMDLGVEQRITGSETEQLRIRNVLRRMYAYFEDEVLSRSEYEHVRGRWCVCVPPCLAARPSFRSLRRARVVLVWAFGRLTSVSTRLFFAAKTSTSCAPSGRPCRSANRIGDSCWRTAPRRAGCACWRIPT